ncbi:hypothetical protein [Salisediminibacterium selenitireducens]|uniref:Uncharacterized protein n=1 Tax=Bacillus selenitireducens (strain ATCC 700615 / DSM 15326 / MLS10) TaxID=439292 RepID=D6XWU8_BACIE|nr:hypothetical protein [Salisediminibacterium selenitireducens]ADH99924.1 hypothetical protein Bsel_2422 [[Bacillus] selenitireducens MLS10]
MQKRREVNFHDFLSDVQRMHTEEMMVRDEDKELMKAKEQESQPSYLFF